MRHYFVSFTVITRSVGCEPRHDRRHRLLDEHPVSWLAGKEGKPDIGVTFHIDFYRPIPKEIYDKHKEDLHGA
jgi:hypothetical protein